MKQYHIAKTQQPINWSNIRQLEVDNILWLPDAGVRMTQQVCYDDDAIYVHQRSVEANIRAEGNDPMAMVCFDSCMEFFFSPDPDSGRYFNFEWNPNGCLYLGWGTGRTLSARLQVNDPVAFFDFKKQDTEDGWEIFYKIPVDFIRLFCPAFQATAGTVLRANVFKCGDLTAQPHYLSWNRCTSEAPDFHRFCDFGTMIFG